MVRGPCTWLLGASSRSEHVAVRVPRKRVRPRMIITILMTTNVILSGAGLVVLALWDGDDPG